MYSIIEMKKLLKHWEMGFFIVLTILFISLNFIPLIVHSYSSPPDRFYALVHDNENDYYLYLSLINEGIHGDTLTTNPYDIVPSQASLVSIFFVFLGKIGGLLGLSSPIIYHAARLIFGFTMLASAYVLLYEMFPKGKRLISFLLMLVAGSFMRTEMYEGKAYPHQYMEWWRGADVLRRVAFYPHHLFGATCMIITVICLFRFLKKPRWAYIVIATISSTLAGIVHPPSSLIPIIALGASVVIMSLIHIREFGEFFSFHKKKIAGLLFYGVGSIPSFLLIRYQTTLGYPWNQLGTEVRWQFEFDKELIPGLGIVVWFAFIGIFKIVKNVGSLSDIDTLKRIYIVCWFVVPIMLMPLAPMMGISNIRLFQGYPYLPMGILAAFGVEWIAHALHARSKFGRNFIFATIVGVIILMCLPTIFYSFRGMMQEHSVPYSNIYLPQSLNNIGQWLTQEYRQTKEKPTILANFYVGNYLPAFAPVRVYTGHHTYTPDREVRAETARKFLSGEMSRDEASTLLTSHGIRYVVISEDEGWGDANTYPELLAPVVKSGSYVVYTPKQ